MLTHQRSHFTVRPLRVKLSFFKKHTLPGADIVPDSVGSGDPTPPGKNNKILLETCGMGSNPPIGIEMDHIQVTFSGPPEQLVEKSVLAGELVDLRQRQLG